MIGRILAVDSINLRQLELEKDKAKKSAAGGPVRLCRPFLSANDRSRWCTIRALVEDDMRVPGVPFAIDRVVQEPLWDTIDMVKHDGHLYSSKPPLLPTLLAAPYWVIYRATGATLGTHPYEIGRALLILINIPTMAVYFWLVVLLAERFSRHDWSRLVAVATAAFGTFLTTFSVVLNNHVLAAASVMIALYAAVRIWFDGERRLRYFAVAGLFAALAVTDELPALALLAPLGLALLWKCPRQTLVGFAPAVLVVAAGFFGANWIAHASLRPAYAHRSTTDPADNWYQYTYQRNGKQYHSYWEDRKGIDRGEPSRAVYALHCLVGHHGIFSLSPIWILSLIGLAIWLVRPDDPRLRELALLILAVSGACFVFYVGVVGLADRNYGGSTCGLRWMFWLIPMWLLTLLPAADLAARRRWTRAVVLVLLMASALSATYPTWNPWTHPWIYNWMQYAGW